MATLKLNFWTSELKFRAAGKLSALFGHQNQSMSQVCLIEYIFSCGNLLRLLFNGSFIFLVTLNCPLEIIDLLDYIPYFPVKFNVIKHLSW